MVKLSDMMGDPIPFKNKKGETEVVHLLVDGDIYAYKAASVADGRTYTLGPKSFLYKSDALKYAKKHKKDVDDIKLEYIVEPVAHSYKSLDYMMKMLKSDYKYQASCKVEVFLTDKINWRNKINPTYKMGRKGLQHVLDYFDGDLDQACQLLGTTPKTFNKNLKNPHYNRRPAHLKKCKDRLKSKYGAITMVGKEADDALGIRYTELVEAGKKACIVSIDKDLDCIPGWHYNSDKELRYKTTAEESLFSFYRQCLTGDKTDTVMGCKGIGDAKSLKILEASDRTNLGYYEAVLETWEKTTGLVKAEAARKLGVSARCLWIQRYKDAYWKEPEEYNYFWYEHEGDEV